MSLLNDAEFGIVRGVTKVVAPSVELNTAGTVALGTAAIAGGSASLGITTAQAVEADASVAATHKLKIEVNGVEYYLPLETV